MVNLLRADLYMLRRTPAVALCLLVCAVAAGIHVWLMHLLAADALDPAAANGVSVLSDAMLVGLLGSLLVGTVVARPFENKSVHDALLGAGRGPFVASRAVVATGAVTLLAVPYGVAALVALGSDAAFTAAVPTSFSVLATGAEDLSTATVARVAVITVVTGLLYAGKLAVCLPLAFRLRPVVVMAAGFTWSFVGDLVFRDVEGLGAFARLTPFAEEYNLTMSSTAGDVVAATGVSVGAVAAMGGLAYLMFRKADVK